MFNQTCTGAYVFLKHEDITRIQSIEEADKESEAQEDEEARLAEERTEVAADGGAALEFRNLESRRREQNIKSSQQNQQEKSGHVILHDTRPGIPVYQDTTQSTHDAIAESAPCPLRTVVSILSYDIETNCIRYRLDGGGGDLSRQQEGHKEPEFSCLPGGVAAVTLPFSSFATYTDINCFENGGKMETRRYVKAITFLLECVCPVLALWFGVVSQVVVEGE